MEHTRKYWAELRLAQWIVLILTLCLALPAYAQHIPPHSNDPHPPTNQPAYQLPSPQSRAGVPQYPGAAHSNDPHFNRTEPRPAWPTAPPPPSARFPSTPGQYLRPTTPVAPSKTARDSAKAKADAAKPRPKPKKAKATTLEDCYRKWDAELGMPRASWEENCRRLSAEGRLGKR